MQFNMGMARFRNTRDIASHNVYNTSRTVNHYHGDTDNPRKDSITDDILSWLDIHSFDYIPAHNDARQRRTPGTLKWFFGMEMYKTWETSEDGKHISLACVGIPGAGKTTTASAVIEELRHAYESDPDDPGSGIVLYAYFRHDNQSSQTVSIVLASLLYQAISKKEHVSGDIKKLYKQYRRSKSAPTVDEMVEALRRELSTYRKAFIIVDALDEYAEESSSSSQKLVAQLEQSNVKLLITSRYPVSFKQDSFSTLQVLAHAQDILIFVKIQVTSQTGNLYRIIKRTPELLEELVRTVVEKSQGMFIMARLLIDCIPYLLTANDVRTALKALPTSPEDVYKLTIKRIQKQRPQLVDLAMKTLSWIYFAKRQLTVAELQHAVSFRHDAKAVNEESLVDEFDIFEASLGLIDFATDRYGHSTCCQFSHYTVKEFLNKYWKEYILKGERLITETCLEYLAVIVSTVPPETAAAAQDWSPKNKVWAEYCWKGQFALCSYAVEYWVDHVKSIDEMFNLTAGARFFRHPIAPYTADNYMIGIRPTLGMPRSHYWTLYFARFGLMRLLQQHLATVRSKKNRSPSLTTSPPVHILLNQIRDSSGWTALHYAAHYSHLAVIEFLLDKQMSIDLPDRDGRTPLHWAVASGRIDSVRLLLRRGAMADLPDRYGRSAVFYAIHSAKQHDSSSPGIIRVLLSCGVNVERVDVVGKSPLSIMRWCKNTEIVRLVREYARAA